MRDRLVKVKDKLCTGKQSSVVYKIPCSCGKFYLGETVRRLGTRIKEHKDACVHGSTEKSAVSDHAWKPSTYKQQTISSTGMLDLRCPNAGLLF